MNLDVYLAGLTRQLADAAALGGEEMVELAERLASPLESAARLVLQDALSDAMQEVTLELAPGAAELRLRGRDISFVVTRPASSGGTAAGTGSGGSIDELPATADVGTAETGEAGTARISFRPPDRLKAQIEAAAERQGLSVNAFLVSTLTAALRPAARASAHGSSRGRRPNGGDQLEGWVH